MYGPWVNSNNLEQAVITRAQKDVVYDLEVPNLQEQRACLVDLEPRIMHVVCKCYWLVPLIARNVSILGASTPTVKLFTASLG